jgi:hydrogenase/urease accessory protein HupE
VRAWAPLVLLALVTSLQAAQAHELRPAYLELRETAPGTWAVLWKVPARDEMRLSIAPDFDPTCQPVGQSVTYRTADAWADRWVMVCAGGLAGTKVRIARLESTLTDALIRVVHLDGTVQTTRLVPSRPAFTLERSPTGWQVARTYLALGTEHILLGIDHLLFLLGLLLLVDGWRRVLATVTAFTIAHSITLAGATLGLVRVPQAPVEAAIALSIVFVGAEVVRAGRGQSGLTERWPWLVAFVFGLLHGFGFAGALHDVGLPAQAIPLALLFFNVGVELGQVAFVLLVVAFRFAYRRLVPWTPAAAWRLPAYVIGSVAAFWVIDRTAQFFH